MIKLSELERSIGLRRRWRARCKAQGIILNTLIAINNDTERERKGEREGRERWALRVM